MTECSNFLPVGFKMVYCNGELVCNFVLLHSSNYGGKSDELLQIPFTPLHETSWKKIQ